MKLALAFLLLAVVVVFLTLFKQFLRKKFREFCCNEIFCIMILTVHNCEHQIEGILREIINWRQISDISFELLVVDKQSTDLTRKIVEKLNYPYQEFQLFSEEQFQIQGLSGLGYANPTKVVYYDLAGQVDFNQAVEAIKLKALQEFSSHPAV